MPYDLGDPVDLLFETRDSVGNYVNVTTINLTVTKPDGTTDTPSVTTPPSQTGRYTVRYTAVSAGRYLARWVATDATNPQAYTDAFDVRDSAPPLLFSLSDAKSILNVSTTMNDGKMRDLIESTTAAVEFLVGPVIRRSVSERYDAGGSDTLVLRSAPVISVTTIVPILTGGLTYDVADVDVDGDTAIVQNRNGKGFIGPLRITYVTGRAFVPAAIRDAGRVILKHLWMLHNGPAGLPRLNEANDPGTTMVLGLGYALPNHALQLLQPYLRVGKFA